MTSSANFVGPQTATNTFEGYVTSSSIEEKKRFKSGRPGAGAHAVVIGPGPKESGKVDDDDDDDGDEAVGVVEDVVINEFEEDDVVADCSSCSSFSFLPFSAELGRDVL